MILQNASRHQSAIIRRHSAMSSLTMRGIRWNREEAIVRLQEEDARLNGLANSSILIPTNPFAIGAAFVGKTFAITELEIRKLRHDPTELITRAIQPVLWLLLFGAVFTR